LYKALIGLKSPIFLIVPILLAGCSGYQYVASPRFLPLNEKKGELTANVYLSGVQVGYAFSNKFSVFATGYQRFPRENVENIGAALGGPSDERVGQSSEINIGVSYFGRKENLLYEVLAGGGLGEMSFATNDSNNKSQSYDYSFYMEANKWNVFIQPNFSFKFNKTKINDFVSLGVFAKFNLLQYYSIETELNKNQNYVGSVVDGIEYFNGRTETYLFFIEPGVFVKVGRKNFKGTAQIAPVLNLSGHAVRENDISFNMGFIMKLDLLKRRNKE
jgi:hypothetical protein